MGGWNASLSAEESVAGMIRVIDRATAADNGRFYTWQGQEREW